mmetsp:Transcript_35490/g.88537  ORF Transcript_35490/g.88537 Transcript_35490/m.88537 type:complete len:228 (-) Transcript_35490:26-709(-)
MPQQSLHAELLREDFPPEREGVGHGQRGVHVAQQGGGRDKASQLLEQLALLHVAQQLAVRAAHLARQSRARELDGRLRLTTPLRALGGEHGLQTERSGLPRAQRHVGRQPDGRGRPQQQAAPPRLAHVRELRVDERAELREGRRRREVLRRRAAGRGVEELEGVHCPVVRAQRERHLHAARALVESHVRALAQRVDAHGLLRAARLVRGARGRPEQLRGHLHREPAQ